MRLSVRCMSRCTASCSYHRSDEPARTLHCPETARNTGRNTPKASRLLLRSSDQHVDIRVAPSLSRCRAILRSECPDAHCRRAGTGSCASRPGWVCALSKASESLIGGVTPQCRLWHHAHHTVTVLNIGQLRGSSQSESSSIANQSSSYSCSES